MKFEIIKAYDNYIIFENGSILNCVTDRFLKINNGKDFYKTVRLRKNNISKTFKLHRLLAESFLYRESGKNYVNHKDGNKLNNNLSNLEWCTQKENMKHAYDIGLLYQSELNKRRLVEVKQKQVLNLENGIYFDSIKHAANAHNISYKKISRLLKNKNKFITV